jgi:DNA-binding MarR family transcriptional regulator
MSKTVRRQDALQQDNPDAVDSIVAQWRVERPDLDPSAKEITGRIIRLAAHFQRVYADAFADLGLNESDYGVLAPLRRAGPPYTLTPSELARHRMITSGGMTAALDRLERKGLVERAPNPGDRRGSLVRLTDDGRRVIDEAMARHATAEHQLVGPLSGAECAALEAALRRLLAALEPPLDGTRSAGPNH